MKRLACRAVCGTLAQFVKRTAGMSARAVDWLNAAACFSGPQPPATFADLPKQHQDDMLRLGFVAVMAVAYFVTLAIMTQPIPSRSLVAPSTLPIAPPSLSAAR